MQIVSHGQQHELERKRERKREHEQERKRERERWHEHGRGRGRVQLRCAQLALWAIGRAEWRTHTMKTLTADDSAVLCRLSGLSGASALVHDSRNRGGRPKARFTRRTA